VQLPLCQRWPMAAGIAGLPMVAGDRNLIIVGKRSTRLVHGKLVAGRGKALLQAPNWHWRAENAERLAWYFGGSVEEEI
jgi:hypothetical protein